MTNPLQGTTTTFPANAAPGTVTTYSSYYVPGAQPVVTQGMYGTTVPYYSYAPVGMQPATTYSGYYYPAANTIGTYGYSPMYTTSGYYTTGYPSYGYAPVQRRGLFGGLFRRNRIMNSFVPGGYTYPYGAAPGTYTTSYVVSPY
jgi:hypothetical protein